MNSQRTIDIEFREEHYLPHQWNFLISWDKTLGLVGGLGSGKSVSFLYKTLICLLYRPGRNGLSNVGIVYPTYELGETIFFAPFCELLTDAGITHSKNKTKLLIETAYGKVTVKSAMYPERIVGDTYTDAGADEIDILPMPKGKKTVRRLRERLRGRVDSQLYLVGSPEGYVTMYDVLKKDPNPGTKLIQARTTDNIYLPATYIADLEATYDSAMLNAYIKGEFTNLNAMTAHYEFDRDKHVRNVPAPPINTIIHVGVDFNVNPLCACAGYYEDDRLMIFDEIYMLNSNTYELADMMDKLYKGKYVVQCYPDPTGTARETSSILSDIEILAKRGYQMNYKHGITQRHSLNLANGDFAHDRIIIDPKCTHLIDDLEQVVTDNVGRISKPAQTMLTHMSDAMRNIVVIESLKKNDYRGRAL